MKNVVSIPNLCFQLGRKAHHLDSLFQDLQGFRLKFSITHPDIDLKELEIICDDLFEIAGQLDPDVFIDEYELYEK